MVILYSYMLGDGKTIKHACSRSTTTPGQMTWHWTIEPAYSEHDRLWVRRVYRNVAWTTHIKVEQLKAYLKVIHCCCGLGQVFVTWWWLAGPFHWLTVIKHFMLAFRRTQDFIFMRILAKEYVMISVDAVLKKWDAEPCNWFTLPENNIHTPSELVVGRLLSFGKVYFQRIS